MRQQRKYLILVYLMIFLGFSFSGCGRLSSSEQEALKSPTPTPTEPSSVVAPDSQSGNPCQELTAKLELQILVGPSEAVGLEPVTVGEIPFVVLDEGNTYMVEGSSKLDSYSDVLSAEWGTYTVTFEGVTVVSGECVSSGDDAELNLNVEMTGEQNVEIIYEGTELNYPWSGTTQIDTTLPVEDGAQQVGEGWILILHLN